MELINFSDYCASIYADPKLGSAIFFKSKTETLTYKELIQNAFDLSLNLKNSLDHAFLLQIESPPLFFTNLLAGIFAKKEMVLISHKEPQEALNRYQKNFNILNVIKKNNIINHNSPLSISKIEGEVIAFNVLSSGSTGPVKKIPLSLKNVTHSALAVIDFFKMNSTDVSLLNLPHHHVGGLMILWRSFLSGGMVTTNENLAYQFISMVPLQLQRNLVDNSKIEKLKNCRGVLIGGAPLDLHLKTLALENSIKIYETYGMSETCSLVMLNGTALKGQQIKLDSQGYFLIKGPTLSPSLKLDNDGFYQTNDIGVIDADGRYSFKHRGDLIFKSAGELINPQLIEKEIKSLPFINDAIVVPIKHAEFTNASTLVYQTNDLSKTDEDIKNHLKNILHPHLIPRYFFKVPGNVFSSGIKPNRFELKKFAQEEYFKSKFNYHYLPNIKSNKLVVVFHGFMEDHTDMIPLMTNSLENSFLYIDLPGHGTSLAGNFSNKNELFLELKSLIEFFVGTDSLILYGYSMGGRVAIELCLLGLSPELLILESASFGLLTNEERANRLVLDRKLFLNRTPNLKDFFNDWYSNSIFGTYKDSQHYETDIAKKIAHNFSEWQASLEFFSPGLSSYLLPDTLDKLNNLNIIGICGTEDKKYLSHFEEVKNKLKNFKVFQIEGAGHNPHKTHVVEVQNILSKLI